MDGNFISRYEAKIDEFEQLISDDPIHAGKYKNEMNQYMFECIPFIQEYNDETQVVTNNNSIFNITSTKGCQKKDIFDDYLEKIEKIPNKNKKIKRKDDTCPNCKKTILTRQTSGCDIVCIECGFSLTILGEEATYKDEHELFEKNITYSYKRSNHFQEWLSQLQANESTKIPVEVIESLRFEFKKMKIKKVDEITHPKVRSLLKKLKMNKYYEHVPYISNILNGIQPMQMSIELQERLRLMFNEIQTPFDKHCPADRKNFLSYSYVLYKFCELLSEDEYLKYFPLLKSREKLYAQDVIWKKICDELQWEFIPTI